VTTENCGRASWSAGRPATGPRHRPATGNDDDRLARDLPALRSAVLTMPDSAPRLLQKRLNRAWAPSEAGHRVDLMILLAEAFLRCRDTTAALQAGRDAVRAADGLPPADSVRRLCAYGVAADIALYSGQPAAAAYNTYLDQLTAAGDWAGDALRTVYARAAYAVAVSREINREHGLRLLGDLCEWSRHEQGRHHAVTIALVAGLTAMRAGCSACGPWTPGRGASGDAAAPAPLPGGMLQPDVTEPDRAYLASRVHDCEPGSR